MITLSARNTLIMNLRQYYQGKLAWFGVLTVIFSALSFIPGIDSTGHAICGTLAGILSIFTCFYVYRARNASAETQVFTADTLHAAPINLQLAFWHRARWLTPTVLAILAVVAAFDIRAFENGETNSFRILFPFNFIYSAFGGIATIASLLVAAAGSYFGIQWIIKHAIPKLEAKNKSNSSPPHN